MEKSEGKKRMRKRESTSVLAIFYSDPKMTKANLTSVELESNKKRGEKKHPTQPLLKDRA